jgi:hypothetical protein
MSVQGAGAATNLGFLPEALTLEAWRLESFIHQAAIGRTTHKCMVAGPPSSRMARYCSL